MNVESPLLHEVRELRLLARGLSRVEAFPTDLLDLMLVKIDRLEVLLTGAPLEEVHLTAPTEQRFAEPVIAEPVIAVPAIAEPATDEPTKRLEHIRVSLTLNDRFLFQRELFGNDSTQMAAFFEALSRCINHTEAASLLRTQCAGHEQTEGYGILMTLLERWFPAHAGLA